MVDLKDESRFLDWLYTEKLASEALQMMREDEEITDAFSYFPYQTDLKLVQKTYYSAAKNPHMYFVIHAVGTLLQSSRSKNANHLSDHNIINNAFNAKIIAYAFANNVSLSKAFIAEGKTLTPSEDVELGDDDLGEPKVADGLAWFTFMSALDFQLIPSMERFIERAKANIGEVREGTIGEYVKNHF